MTEVIINIAKLGNKYIDVQAPWTLRKTDEARMRTVLYVLAETLRITAVLLSPVMADSCGNMLDQLGESSFDNGGDFVMYSVCPSV